MRLTSKLTWDRPEAWFGGFSGAEVTEQGSKITLITDKGNLLTADLIRQGEVLITLDEVRQTALKYASGTPLAGKFTDAEGLAIAPDGTTHITFEHVHRLARLIDRDGRTQVSGPHADFEDLQLNAGLEALAIHPDGTLYMVPERSGARTRPFPLYTLDGRRWRIQLMIPRRGPFLPVGADFDAAGRLYLLERAATPLGFRSRIRRFDLNAPDLGEITLLRSPPGRFDNLEGLSVWQDGAGTTHLTLISDDNFLAIQRTQIVEFALTE